MREQEHLDQEEYFDENQYEIENRIRNLYWTVSGNYGDNIKLDTVSFCQIALGVPVRRGEAGGLFPVF